MRNDGTQKAMAAAAVLAVVAGALSACGGGSPTAGPNAPPAGTFTFAPGTPALVGATVVRFTANGTDPEGDAISYAWNFGDGGSATGASVTHVFGAAGSFNVALTLSDGKGAQSTAANTVVAKSITGRWVDNDPRFKWNFVQSGSTFTGVCCGGQSEVRNGRVSDPRGVAFYRFEGVALDLPEFDYVGSLDESLDHIDVVSIPIRSFHLTRQ
jgi:hypothetical protein